MKSKCYFRFQHFLPIFNFFLAIDKPWVSKFFIFFSGPDFEPPVDFYGIAKLVEEHDRLTTSLTNKETYLTSNSFEFETTDSNIQTKLDDLTAEKTQIEVNRKVFYVEIY